MFPITQWMKWACLLKVFRLSQITVLNACKTIPRIRQIKENRINLVGSEVATVSPESVVSCEVTESGRIKVPLPWSTPDPPLSEPSCYMTESLRRGHGICTQRKT